MRQIAKHEVRGAKPAGQSQSPPLDPAVIKLIDALARAQAKEDHERESNPHPASLPR
jgi:hypothetical protein